MLPGSFFPTTRALRSAPNIREQPEPRLPRFGMENRPPRVTLALVFDLDDQETWLMPCIPNGSSRRPKVSVSQLLSLVTKAVLGQNEEA